MPGLRPNTRPSNAQGPTGRGAAADDSLEFERALFFSDAVFAIAITLLVIEVRLPALPEHPTDADIVRAIGRIMPSIFAYVLSFATIGLYWLAHWRRYRYVVQVDERLVALNLLLLGLVAFIPFPTAMIGEYGDLGAPVIVYALSLSAAGLVGSLTWLYAWRSDLITHAIPVPYIRSAALRGFAVPLVMIASLGLLPFAGPGWVEASWLLILPVQVVMNRVVGKSDTR
jgi:uncharacterized membrane protein